MATYLRIDNRGGCPRELLMIFGATTKRDRMDDPTQGGWFGSGTKMAPVAALALGMEVVITSHDDQGPYLLKYGMAVREVAGRTLRIVTISVNGAPPTETMLSADAFPNWSKPIGHDGMKSFRVLREYLRNALDADPTLRLWRKDSLETAPEGWTCVYLPFTDEVGAMFKASDRYFKYVGSQPLCVLPGVGAVFPKSEPGMTRLFSLGTMAFCSLDGGHGRATFDYSFDRKELVSEERVFSDIGAVYRQLAILLANLRDADLLETLLRDALRESGHHFEAGAFQHVPNDAPVPAAAEWLEAWRRCCGENAVIATGAAFPDQSAERTYGKAVLAIGSASLRVFLRRCGVQTSLDVVPKTDDKEYLVVEMSPEEEMRVGEVRAKLHLVWPEMADVPVQAFMALTEKQSKHYGFVNPAKGGGFVREVFIQKPLLASEYWILDVLQHEYRHLRTGAPDASLHLEASYNDDGTWLLAEKLGIPDDRSKLTESGPPGPDEISLDFDAE